MLGERVELLFHRKRDLYRSPRQKRQRHDKRLQLDVELRAEAPAQIRHLDAHLVLGPAEKPRDLDAHEGRALRGRVDRERGVPGIRRGDEWLERHVQHLLGAEGVLVNLMGLLERALDIAAPQLKLERDIRVLLPLEVFEIRERSGRLERLVHHCF